MTIPNYTENNESLDKRHISADDSRMISGFVACLQDLRF